MRLIPFFNDRAMDCTQEYLQLITTLDAEIARVAQRHVATLSCGPGCASCCLAFSVLPLEAAWMRQAIAALPATDQEQLERNLTEDPDRCPLLLDDLCSIYAARPIICRTQGLPLAYVDAAREAIEVSACGLNFPDDHAFTLEHLLFMDPFNTRLAELNQAWCRKRTLDPPTRIPLRELACSTPPKP
ncbi:YkgJ family cysteine cluster protein [Thiovibrio frasassiensis]|uniref:YkgJ family cysteine cluster protein n=1 Tax=Thiovibrio frasassiensis TaxID=2984131 RepID=A0A9X4MG53_9BACT|nr:YkgJ family cysteine cluster protein [Thiovibrio frasassiensis]MDG4475788.1 YkgJ family cysteine cluster protein [Thiovibrio frasassiensis]